MWKGDGLTSGDRLNRLENYLLLGLLLVMLLQSVLLLVRQSVNQDVFSLSCLPQFQQCNLIFYYFFLISDLRKG